jgi:hypothetical protein
MKKKSELYPEVLYELWKTPVMDNPDYDLTVKCVLQAGDQVHFFLCYRKMEEKEMHVLSIPRGYPYRVMEEGYAYAGVGQYFRYKDSKKKRRSSGKYYSTWKLWNTRFIRELNGGEKGKGELSGYGQIKLDKIIHYVVSTGGDVIEFIAPTMHWEIHKNMKIEQLLELYAKKRFYEKYNDEK